MTLRLSSNSRGKVLTLSPRHQLIRKGFTFDPMGTNYAPLVADIFLYSYEAQILHVQSLLSTGKKQQEYQFNFAYRYIDEVLSINNPYFENYLDQMYQAELEIKDTTESNTSASYLDFFLSIRRDCQLCTSRKQT